ncbi:hypothetical protein [Desulfomicrobium macestii]|uniref:hypothetical protein n=1 Tax=Desulfomicrobium macestii TaxID=90731 RepID=UPI00178A2308|nr:hypothetical protein [Desulfomicrobium macestii]
MAILVGLPGIVDGIRLLSTLGFTAKYLDPVSAGLRLVGDAAISGLLVESGHIRIQADKVWAAGDFPLCHRVADLCAGNGAGKGKRAYESLTHKPLIYLVRMQESNLRPLAPEAINFY